MRTDVECRSPGLISTFSSSAHHWCLLNGGIREPHGLECTLSTTQFADYSHARRVATISEEVTVLQEALGTREAKPDPRLLGASRHRRQIGSVGLLLFLLLLLSVGVWPPCAAAAAAAAVVTATSKPPNDEVLPHEDSGPLDLPLCDCVGGVQDAAKATTSSCSLSFSMPGFELCFVPPSYCAEVESTDSLAAAVSQTPNYDKDAVDLWQQSAKWAKLEKQAKLLETMLPVSEAPACRCWALGSARVAPCDHQGLQGIERPWVESTAPDHQQQPIFSLPINLDSPSPLQKHEANSPPTRTGLGGSFSDKGAADVTGYIEGKADQEPLLQSSLLSTGEEKSRRLSIRGGTSGSKIPATREAAVKVGSGCHASCFTCGGPGRDQCLSCPNQLPYPYIPPKDEKPTAFHKEDSPANQNSDGSLYHALIAAHRNGSGYCIPLAFGKEETAAASAAAAEAPDDWCLATSSACTTASASAWWASTSGSWFTGKPDDHCHPTCSACRADCCTGKPDNCLACKGTRRVFHPIYRDGTGRCLDVTQPESESESNSSPSAWEGREATPDPPASSEDDEGTAFGASSVETSGETEEKRQRGSQSTKGSGLRNTLSFLPRRSICESLPQRVRDMPIRAWSQLMFIHADNNLEESALLDLDEMLHPWRGEVVKRNARAASHGRGTPPLPIGGSALPGPGAHEALEDLYLVVLIDRSHQASSTDMGTVHACPQLEYSKLGQGAREIPGTSEVELDTKMAFELLRIHLQDGRREWLLLRALGEVDMNDPVVLQTTVTRFLDMFPSRHYAVTLWNHGSAWAGFGDDESNPNNQPMSIHDIAAGLTNGIRGSKLGKVDRAFRLSLLGFDACLMGSYDVLEALAPLTHFFLASEENEPGHGWNYRSMDPTTLNRKPPPLYRTATAFEYGTRFVTSYGLHPPSSNALTLALIEVRTFNEFKQKFEELLETFSIRGCRMLGLCSCYDLSDFLANLLQQFASDENEFGKISLQSYEEDDEFQPAAFKSRGWALPPGATKPRALQQSAQPRPSVNALGAATRALTDKVVAARFLFRKMVVAEVGSREPGRYGGLSIYFPDPNMAVNCKTQRNASSWARRYTSTIRTKFSSFVTSVLTNRKGSVCYAPWGSTGGTGDSTPSLPQPGAEKPQWFGFATIHGSQRDGPEIIVTSTSQATMTDAEMKGSEVPFGFPSPFADRQPESGSPSPAPRENLDAASDEVAASLREFTLVQGWWDSQVWTLKQLVRLEDPLKDPRPPGHNNANSGGSKEFEVESIVVALQDGPASSRANSARTTSISFPFLFFKDALDAECLEDPLLHMEALSKPRALGNDAPSSNARGTSVRHRMHQFSAPGIQPRYLRDNDTSTAGSINGEQQAKRYVLSTTVLPLGIPMTYDEASGWDGLATPNSSAGAAHEAGGSEKPLASFYSHAQSDSEEEEMRPRNLGSSPVGTAAWLLHERLGREPQRDARGQRQCGIRAYLLAEWDEQQQSVSDPVLYVVENELATEWPRAKGGLLRPIEHRLKRKLLSAEEVRELLEVSKRLDGSGLPGQGSSSPASRRKARRLPDSSSAGVGFRGSSSLDQTKSTSMKSPLSKDSSSFKAPQGLRDIPRNVAATVLEESLGKSTFFWNIASEANKLILQPKSVSRVLEQRRASTSATAEAAKRRHIERPVVGIIAQDIFDQRSVITNSLPLIQRNEPGNSHGVWESVGQAFGILGSPSEGNGAPTTPISITTCPSHWLGDGICDDLCDTPKHNFDKGDCPHRNRFAEYLLEQQEVHLLMRDSIQWLRINA
ncbi:hypothetical protein Emag_000492 [Eimeria magna]